MLLQEVPLQFAQVLAVTKPTCASGLLHMALHLVFEATASATKGKQRISLALLLTVRQITSLPTAQHL